MAECLPGDAWRPLLAVCAKLMETGMAKWLSARAKDGSDTRQLAAIGDAPRKGVGVAGEAALSPFGAKEAPLRQPKVVRGQKNRTQNLENV